MNRDLLLIAFVCTIANLVLLLVGYTRTAALLCSVSNAALWIAFWMMTTGRNKAK